MSLKETLPKSFSLIILEGESLPPGAQTLAPTPPSKLVIEQANKKNCRIHQQREALSAYKGKSFDLRDSPQKLKLSHFLKITNPKLKQLCYP